MRHIKDIYPLVNEVRQRIIEKMRAENIVLVQFCPVNEEEYLEEHEGEKDVQGYGDYRDEHCPYVIWFDKYGSGEDLCVISVSFMDGEHPYFVLHCEGEYDGKDVCDCDVAWLTMLNVYEMLEKHLELEDEPEKIWIVKQESNDDGEMHFSTQPCKDEATARSVLREWRDALLTRHPKYCDARPYIDGEKDPDDQECCFEWEDHDAGFYIQVLGDDYYENITIEEEEIR